jgi:polyisoprenoid-binding protein YceI
MMPPVVMRGTRLLAVALAPALALSLAMALFSSAPAAADAPRWSVVGAESTITVVATQLGSPFEAVFRSFSADIRFDPDHPEASSAKVVIDVSSFDSGNADRDARALGPDFFDVAAHPEATFETMRFRRGGGGWIADAALTIKGVPRPVSLPFTLRIDGERAEMTGTLEIDRGDFAVGTGEWAPASSGVGRTVGIDLHLLAVRDADGRN